MSWFFRQSSRKNDTTSKAAAGLRIQSSVQGRPLPLLLGGQSRVAGNLLWYGDFAAQTIYTPAAGTGGGKGSVGGGGGGKGASGTTSYTYSAAVAWAVAEGQIGSIQSIWNNKTQTSSAQLGLEEFNGSYSQSPWGYLSANHPDQALNYRGIAYAAAGPLQLGDTAELPNLTFEIKSLNADVIAGLPDGDISAAATALLTSAFYGLGFPVSRWATPTDWMNYSLAMGMAASPLLTDQTDAASILKDWIEWTDCDACWSGGVMKIVPRAGSTAAANGYVYVPNTTPIYDFDDVDYLPNQGSMGGGGGKVPLAVSRRPVDSMVNNVRAEYLDRTNAYNPVIVERKDEASIIAFSRERPSDVKALHWLCDANAAQRAVDLQLIRQQIPRMYQWTAGRRFILLDPCDLVTVTDPSRNIVRQGVRLTEISENSDGTLTFTGEEWPGVPGPPLYGQQATGGYVPDLNVDPGALNAPIIFEPTFALAGALEIWAAISGVDTSLWGGADVYASYDNETYAFVGRVVGPARMGSLTATLAPYTANPTGPPTIDITNTLSVNLAESGGTLVSGTLLDATSLNTACYVGGEIIAYQTATLTGVNAYNLTTLVRGAYETTDAMENGHASGERFARLDQGVMRVPYDQTRVGQTVFLKFASFNIWGGGKQSLADVPAYTYAITGFALTQDLPDVENLRTVFVDGCTNLAWDEVVDFRVVRYEIRLGDSVESALSLGTVAHPPFVIPGNGTYWVAATAEPLPGLIVYSENWTTVEVTGATLVTNVVATWDEKATGWTGTFSGGAGVDGSAIRSALGVNGGYHIPIGHIIRVGYVAPCLVSIKFLPTGVPGDQDILTDPDILNNPDILGAASTRFIRVRPQIRVAQFADSDLYESLDLYGEPDLYSGAVQWGDWQDFTPGVYLGMFFDFQLLLETIDPGTYCYDLEFSFTVDVPDRIDTHALVSSVLTSLTNLPLAGVGTAIVFVSPTGSTAEPFNGGPGAASVPNIQVTIRDAQAGDILILSSVTLSGATIQVKNAGVGVVRNVDVRPQGY